MRTKFYKLQEVTICETIYQEYDTNVTVTVSFRLLDNIHSPYISLDFLPTKQNLICTTSAPIDKNFQTEGKISKLKVEIAFFF